MINNTLPEIYSDYKLVDLEKEKSIKNIKFNIIHLTGLKKESFSYENSVTAEIQLFDMDKKERYVIKERDGLNFYQGKVYSMAIFEDGSTCIHLDGQHYIETDSNVLMIKKT